MMISWVRTILVVRDVGISSCQPRRSVPMSFSDQCWQLIKFCRICDIHESYYRRKMENIRSFWLVITMTWLPFKGICVYCHFLCVVRNSKVTVITSPISDWSPNHIKKQYQLSIPVDTILYKMYIFELTNSSIPSILGLYKMYIF